MTSLRDRLATRSLAGVAALGASALILSACGAPPPSGGSSGGTSATTSNYLGCMVSDSGGFDDKSFNQSGFEGLQAAVKDLGIQEKHVQSKADTDYDPNLRSMVSAGCKLTVTVGFLLGDATKSIATANPNSHFAIIDYNDPTFPKNVKPIVYDTAQAAFLAGYLAAGVSKTGKVATFGGIKLPTVTIFMDGFADGVKYYNQKKGKSVQVLGWDKDKQDGVFVGDFKSIDKGKVLTQGFLQQGADIVLPVAGPVGQGAGSAILDANKTGASGKLLWVDSDGYLTAPDYKSVILSSVQKTMTKAVEAVLKDDKDGKFDSAPYIGTLENGGVALAPFHDLDSAVPADLKGELDQLKKDIISGTVQVTSQSSPKK
ncbi:BMP family ABC transporter substrate-binding protein [Sinomonas sp. ASV322]|uniref:BMP family lipoprotein n=1 Tax=Sinomonas sp. ASV322 TaxID=3041920 RepID=UPI0027DB123C|nr:BMP family ABC transporter substrate-binding protein [Sinomonas sp. ASV322]MDQ4503629.1 BMP family ABC transporter substrate-binding protein [Sinomonas sp. ASV322]